MRWDELLEIIGAALVICFGIVLIFIFVQIEVLGYYGQEQNAILRRGEIAMGLVILAIGAKLLWRLVRK